MDRRTLLTSLAPPSSAERRRSDTTRILTETESRELSRRILSLVEADEARVNLSSGWDGNTRYAVNRITTAGDTMGVTASILVRFGRRSATVSTNRFDDESLRETIERAVALAQLAPEDPEAMPELEPATFAAGAGWSDATAALAAEPRARVAADAIRRADAGGHEVAGFLEVAAGASSVANSRGLFAYHRSTSVDYSVTARTADGAGSGWAGLAHRDWGALDTEELHERALSKAVASREARPLPPGVYPAILEPAAVLAAGALSRHQRAQHRQTRLTPGSPRRAAPSLQSGKRLLKGQLRKERRSHDRRKRRAERTGSDERPRGVRA